ncbi:MAG: CNNM domain-containing protein [Verrucomicrobiota bacterium]|nr:CNNM domain-containing protein [Limisphaera sp.]MDW8382014.1 CNNM domain-containing protein [Verrucomicrobiota bacterium]
MTEFHWWWGLLGVMLAVSFLLSGMEAGLFAVNRLRVRSLARQGRSSARLLLEHLEQPESFLWTIVVGNALANAVVLGWVFVQLYRWAEGWGWRLVGSYGLAMYLFYTFFDLLPKMWFRSRPNRLCLACAPVFRGVYVALRPLVWLLENGSRRLLHWTGGRPFKGRLFGDREEMHALMVESARGLTSAERQMITRVLELSTVSARALTRTWEESPWIESDATVGTLLARARDRGWSHVVVRTRVGGGEVLGMVSVDRILFSGEPDPHRSVEGWLEPALLAEENERLEVLLRRMQGSGRPLAVIQDARGEPLGTLDRQDILRMIFGDLRL